MAWKTHPKYSNYEVSDTGLVRGKSHNKVLKTRYNKSNKPSVALRTKDGVVHRFIGELVLETFRGKNKYGHNKFKNLDGNVENNNLSNLIWKRFKHTNQLPVLQVDESGKIIKRWDSVIQASMEGGFYQSSIIACCQRKMETHNGFYWFFNIRNKNYINVRMKEITATSDKDTLTFKTLLEAYYYFIKNLLTFSTYESFCCCVTNVKNKRNKTYLGYHWKERTYTRKIEIYG